MKLKCPKGCGEVEPKIVLSGPHQKAVCPRCWAYIKFLPKEKRPAPVTAFAPSAEEVFGWIVYAETSPGVLEVVEVTPAALVAKPVLDGLVERGIRAGADRVPFAPPD